MSTFKPRFSTPLTGEPFKRNLLKRLAVVEEENASLREEIEALKHELAHFPMTDEGWDGLSDAEREAQDKENVVVGGEQ